MLRLLSSVLAAGLPAAQSSLHYRPASQREQPACLRCTCAMCCRHLQAPDLQRALRCILASGAERHTNRASPRSPPSALCKRELIQVQAVRSWQPKRSCWSRIGPLMHHVLVCAWWQGHPSGPAQCTSNHELSQPACCQVCVWLTPPSPPSALLLPYTATVRILVAM